MNSREKLIQRTMDVHREITQAGLRRRDLLKMGLLSAGTGMLLPIQGLSLRAAHADTSCPVPGVEIKSPVTRPWVEELPRLVEKQTVLNNDLGSFNCGKGGDLPGPTPCGTLIGGDSKIRLCAENPAMETATPLRDLGHQGWGQAGILGNQAPKKWYEMRAKQFNHVWHKDMPAGAAGQPAWGFDGVLPGPMFRTRYGESHFTRIHNDLPAQNLGFGINQITTHMHNLHSPSESDGNPLYTNYSGHYYDYHYPNVYAGVNQYGGIGNPNEALGTLWYHDHQLDFTSQNVYAGLAGMNTIYDAHDIYADSTMGDYGDETKGWRLPAGSPTAAIPYEFDVGLVFHDRQFDPRGVDYFPLACFDGAIGDKYTVNGKIQPYMPVKARKYRFRMLAMGPSRTYNWVLNNGASFVVIANDGNLLPAPVLVKSFWQTTAERFDVIMDFSKFKPGTEIILINQAEQVNGRGPTGKLLGAAGGAQVLKFIVQSSATQVVDDSRIPAKLRPLPYMGDMPVSKVREWKFDRAGGEWTVNGLPYDRDSIRAEIPEGSAEQWNIINGGGSWMHPVHIHYEEHRYLSYNGTAPEPLAAGRKDVIRLDANAKCNIYMRFRDYKGIYPMHCHNVVHEDHAMMIMWKIV